MSCHPRDEKIAKAIAVRCVSGTHVIAFLALTHKAPSPPVSQNSLEKCMHTHRLHTLTRARAQTRTNTATGGAHAKSEPLRESRNSVYDLPCVHIRLPCA